MLLSGQDGDLVFQGTVVRIEGSYGWVEMDGARNHLFVHSSHVDAPVWQLLKRGDRVCFALGFSFSGPLAAKLEAIK